MPTSLDAKLFDTVLVLEMSSDDSNLEDPMAELKLVVTASNGVTVFLSQKWGEIAVHQLHMYMKNNVTKTGWVYYNCRKKTAGYRGSLTLEADGAVYGMATHNHVADPRIVTAEMKKAKLRE